MAKAKKQKMSVTDTTVTLQYPTIRKSVSVDLKALDEALQLKCALHGLGQKLGDAKSGGTPAEKYAMASRIRDALLNGEWEVTADRDDSEVVIAAVARVKGVAVKEVQDALEAAEDKKAKVAEWRSNARVKAMIYTIKAERAAEAVDEEEDEDDVKL